MEPTQPNSGAAGAAAAGAPDPQTADIMARHAKGEKLTSQEYGKLGAFSRWLKNPFGKNGGAPQSPGAGPQPGNAAAVAAVASGQAPADSLEPVAVDDGLCQRTATALLSRGDAAISAKVERKARAIAESLNLDPAKTEKMVDRFRSAACLPTNDKRLLVDLSPDVCRELGINPREFALATVGGVLGLHLLNIWEAMDELKDLARSLQPKAAEAPKPVAPGPAAPKIVEAVSTINLPDPPTPPGAPPLVKANTP